MTKSLKRLIAIYGEILINSLSPWQVNELKKKGSILRTCQNCGMKIVVRKETKYYSRCPQCFKTFKIYRRKEG